MKCISVKSILIVFVTVISFLSASCSAPEKGDSPVKTSEIRVVHAGSLSIPFKQIAAAFMKKHPEFEVLLEAYGSRTCARQITDLKRRIDVMASADSAVIQNLLIPQYADFRIDFTTNEMIIMHTPHSKYADTINAGNWFEILLKPGVQYGHSDPNADPCGYRTLLTWQLAEKYYKEENLYNRLREKMPRKNIRAKEVDLIALLETGELDYIFIYRSVAEQHKAKYVILPDEINLRSTNKADFYKTAVLNITGKKPGEWIEKRGAPMVYGITIPKNAPNPNGAAAFVAFVLGKQGQDIMKKNGQPEIIPPLVDQKDNLPEILKKTVEFKENI